MIVYNMPKATKSTKGASKVSTPPVDESKSVAKTVESAPAVKKSAKGKSKVVEVVAAAMDVNTVVEDSAPVTETADVVLTDAFSEFMAKFQTLVSQMNSLKTEFRTLEKKAVRELKAAQKLSSKRKRKSGNRSPSGFVKPTLISTELATFLKKPPGTEMARTEVTREINGYIRANNLQDKQNGRKINPDAHLATLLKIGSDEELTYFNLQRYMSPHFAKANSGGVPEVEKKAAMAASASASA